MKTLFAVSYMTSTCSNDCCSLVHNVFQGVGLEWVGLDLGLKVVGIVLGRVLKSGVLNPNVYDWLLSCSNLHSSL